MAIVAADWEVDRATKVISYVGDDHDGSPSYATVIQLHRWLQDLSDDPYATPSTNDEIDISTLNPSSRSTDNIITLINGYTLDLRAPEHLYDGSIIQDGGDTIWDGIVNYGPAYTQIAILQNGKVVSDDWWNYNSAGLNPDASKGISHRFMIKVREDGVDIDGRVVIGVSRMLSASGGWTFHEFKINGTNRGNNTLALAPTDDINNNNLPSGIAAWTGITNTEGLTLIDIDNNGANEEYYSEWDTNKPTRTINDFYERMKWIAKQPIAEDSNSDSGSDFVVDNATITGAAQSFSVGSNNMLVTSISVPIKIGAGSPTGTIVASIYSHSGTYGTSSVPNALQGSVSDPIDVTKFTSTYERTVFHFPSPVSVTASTYYCIVLEHADGDASNYLHVEGLASSGTHGGNRSHNTAGWTAVAADDLAFEVFTSPQIHSMPGIEFRGITHSFPYDAEYGGIAIATNDDLVWGTLVDHGTVTGGPFVVGEAIHEDTSTPVWKGRVLGVDVTNTSLVVDITSGTVGTGESFTGQTSGAQATTSGTPTAVTGGGSMRVLAIDDDGSTGNVYVQTLKGTAPSDLAVVYMSDDHTDYIDVSADATERNISTPFCGQSTGSSIIGAYGFAIEYLDATNNDKFTALDGTTRTPPNNVQNSVSGLVTTGSDEDYVLVAPWDGVTYDSNNDPAINTNQMLLSTALTTDDVASVVVKNGDETAIPADTPSAGWIRVVDNNGFHRRLKYSSWTGTTFTIDTAWHTANDSQNDFNSVNASVDNHVYVTYLDEEAQTATESYTAVYNSDRDLVVIVRNGKTSVIKQFIAEWSFINTNQTINAIHTTDT